MKKKIAQYILEKWTKKGQKKFLILLKNLVINFYWIFTIMNIYIIS